MGLHFSALVPGTKFVDDSLKTMPPHHRVHKITDLTRGGFRAYHFATGNYRDFTVKQTDDLRIIMPDIDAMASFDGLIGEKIRIVISGSDTPITGMVTAVYYHEVKHLVKKANSTLKMLKAIELDKSVASTYSPLEIDSLQIL